MEQKKTEAKNDIKNAMTWVPDLPLAECLKLIVMGRDLSSVITGIESLEARQDMYDAQIDAAADQTAIDKILSGVARQ